VIGQFGVSDSIREIHMTVFYRDSIWSSSDK